MDCCFHTWDDNIANDVLSPLGGVLFLHFHISDENIENDILYTPTWGDMGCCFHTSDENNANDVFIDPLNLLKFSPK